MNKLNKCCKCGGKAALLIKYTSEKSYEYVVKCTKCGYDAGSRTYIRRLDSENIWNKANETC